MANSALEAGGTSRRSVGKGEKSRCPPAAGVDHRGAAEGAEGGGGIQLHAAVDTIGHTEHLPGTSAGPVGLHLDGDAFPYQVGEKAPLRLAGGAGAGEGDSHGIAIADGGAVREGRVACPRTTSIRWM